MVPNEMRTEHELTKEKYRRHAPSYDSVGAPLLGASYQRGAVALLELAPGDVVVDAGCGTGGNFAWIEREIGDTGQIVGIDLSPDMLEQARILVDSRGWENVRLINAPAEEAHIDQRVNAFLFSFTHDILQSSSALQNLFGHAAPGARVVACGIKWAPWWNVPVNLYIFQVAQHYHTIQAGLEEPWVELKAFVPNLHLSLRAFGSIYLVYGTLTEGAPTGVRRSRPDSTEDEDPV